MANLIWSIALAAAGVTGLWLAGSRHRVGWAIGLYAQVAWMIFGIVSGQYGFIASAIAYGIVYARNLFRNERRELRKITVRLTADTSQYVAAMAEASRRTG